MNASATHPQRITAVSLHGSGVGVASHRHHRDVDAASCTYRRVVADTPVSEAAQRSTATLLHIRRGNVTSHR
jgi:hypothetical protein